jgi:uncharacterized protein YndB with AHSA1/START domain
MAEEAAIPHTVPEQAAALHLERTFAAPREEVYRAWTDPQAMTQWFGSRSLRKPHAEADVRPGGRYRITMKGRSGYTMHCVGTYLEVEPPERLVYTFAWKKMGLLTAGMGDSLVTVEFRELDGSTEVHLTHELRDTRWLHAFHRWGWRKSLDNLERLL